MSILALSIAFLIGTVFGALVCKAYLTWYYEEKDESEAIKRV